MGDVTVQAGLGALCDECLDGSPLFQSHTAKIHRKRCTYVRSSPQHGQDFEVSLVRAVLPDT